LIRDKGKGKKPEPSDKRQVSPKCAPSPVIPENAGIQKADVKRIIIEESVNYIAEIPDSSMLGRKREDNMMWHWGGWGVGMMVLGFVITIIFWGAIIALVVWAVRRVAGHSSSSQGGHTPLDIAKERYARGEITKEQFEQIKRDLSA
jgi:putative membrane protein